MKLKRFEGNPIIAPTKNWWEVEATFNAGATVLNNEIILLYRAIGGDGLSRFGLATSRDGFHFERFPNPLLEADPNDPSERLGIEDPRIVNVEGTYYITYTAASVYASSDYKTKELIPSLNHPAPWKIRPALVITKDFKNFEKKGILLDLETKDAVLFPEKINGQFVLFHRIYPDIQITFSADLKAWHDEKMLISPRPEKWDAERVGAGSPPIKTKFGWLIFYHGVSKDLRYMIGILLLDLADPTKILYRSDQPIFEPETAYEKVGITPNVVFTCGAIEKEKQILVYYGAADRVLGVASLDKFELRF